MTGTTRSSRRPAESSGRSSRIARGSGRRIATRRSPSSRRGWHTTSTAVSRSCVRWGSTRISSRSRSRPRPRRPIQPQGHPDSHKLVAARFDASLVDSAQHRYVSQVVPSRYELPRFLVTANLSPQDLFAQLSARRAAPAARQPRAPSHQLGRRAGRPQVGVARPRRPEIRGARAHLAVGPLGAQERAPPARRDAAHRGRPPGDACRRRGGHPGHPAGRQQPACNGHGRPVAAPYPRRYESPLRAPSGLLAPPRGRLPRHHPARRRR